MTDKTESFALILPSDASPSLHPENTASSWQVALPHAIHLDPQKDWYVSLRDVYIPNHLSKITGNAVLTLYYTHHDDGGEIQGIKDVTAVSADEKFTGDVLTHLDKSMKKLKPPPKIKGREKIKLKFEEGFVKPLVVQWNYTRPGPVYLKSVPNQWAKLEFDEVWKAILQLDQRRFPLYNITEQEEVVLEIHSYLMQPATIMRYTLPRGILNGALELLSRRVNVTANSYQNIKSYFGKWNRDWSFLMKSAKTDVDVVGMMKISAWLQEMLGIQAQVRRPWLELNFRNWKKPGALSKGRELPNGYKEVEIVNLRSGDGTAYQKVYRVLGMAFSSGVTYGRICFSYGRRYANKQTVYMDKRNLTFKHETTLNNTWKGIHYDADIYHQINVKTPGLLDDDCNYASEDSDVLRHIIRPSHDRSSSKPSDTELTELVIKRDVLKRMKPGLNRIQDIKCSIEDSHKRKIPFADGAKSTMTLHVQPMKRLRYIPEFTVHVNCQTDFKLVKPIEVETGVVWRLAMTDIILPHNFYNVHADEMVITLTKANGRQQQVQVPPGAYTPETLLKKINELQEIKQVNLLFSMRQKDKHVAILNRGKETFGIEASLPLGNVLGWTKGMPTKNMTPGATLTCEDTAIDPTRGFKILYVYCPKLVEETIVGHTSASLLNKFVPDYSQSTEYIQFDNPLYIKLRQGVRTIPSITVEVADSLARNLIFPGNSLIVPKVTLTFTCLQNG